MERVRQQILELLRSSLWGTTPSAELFRGDVNWQLLLSESTKQSILGSIYIQLEGLESKPPKSSMMRLHTLTTINRTMSLKQLKALETITKRFQEAGIERPVLLKGLGVASNYIDPGARQCGDIDLYVGKKDYEKACLLALSWSESCSKGTIISHKHCDFKFDGVAIEIHRIAISNCNVTRHHSKFEDWCAAHLEGDSVRHEQIEGVDVYLPPYNFDALYIFLHAWGHFSTYGISFRQICDWSRYLVIHNTKIDQEQLATDLKYFGLIRPWNYFAALATKHLGLDPSAVVCYDPSKDWRTELISEKIWRGGNFGFYDGTNGTAARKGMNVILRKSKSFFAIFTSVRFIYSIDLRYAYNFLLHTPFSRTKSTIYEFYYRFTHKPTCK